MISIAVTQRAMDVQSHPERRDALDQRWTELLLQNGLWPVLVPNNERYAATVLEREVVRGLLLTGGESLVSCGGGSPERDKVETHLLTIAVARKLPVVGVCRGMQVIQSFFGVPLVAVEGHVRTRHRLRTNPASRYAGFLDRLETVNAYHEIGALTSVSELIVSAWAEDGIVMSIEHCALPIFGQMWHSEREDPFVPEEVSLLKSTFETVIEAWR